MVHDRITVRADEDAKVSGVLERKLSEKLAASRHMVWYRTRIARGATTENYPDLVPWKSLSDESREAAVDRSAVYVRLLGAREELPEVLAGKKRMENLDETAESLARDIHADWLEAKVKAGWRHGPAKDVSRKTHPMVVPFSLLSEPEKEQSRLVAKQTVFLAAKMYETALTERVAEYRERSYRLPVSDQTAVLSEVLVRHPGVFHPTEVQPVISVVNDFYRKEEMTYSKRVSAAFDELNAIQRRLIVETYWDMRRKGLVSALPSAGEYWSILNERKDQLKEERKEERREAERAKLSVTLVTRDNVFDLTAKGTIPGRAVGTVTDPIYVQDGVYRAVPGNGLYVVVNSVSKSTTVVRSEQFDSLYMKDANGDWARRPPRKLVPVGRRKESLHK